eukprot:1253244-Prymnesium_polylepis.1
MAACLDSPTLPMVQWNAEAAGRDPDLAAWGSVLSEKAAWARALARPRSWACREGAAVFRGSANQLHTYNNEWSSARHVRRTRTTNLNFNASGRWAFVEQRLRSPGSLNVRLSVLRRGDTILGRSTDELRFRRRVAAVSTDMPAGTLPLEEQARRFRFVVHAEGHGGWADRLKHLLVSGSAVIKQDAGVQEWFEPSLVPGVHYLAATSDLSNLSAVVESARRSGDGARAVALRAAEWAERVLAPSMIVEYAVALFQGYAHLMRYPPDRDARGVRYRCWPALINRSVQGCSDHVLLGRQLTDCGFVAGRRIEEHGTRPGPPAPTQIFATLRSAANASSRRVARKKETLRGRCLVPGVV